MIPCLHLLCWLSFRTPIRDLRADTWVAVDGLGRAAPLSQPVRRNRTVGMFYFLANHVPNAPVYDVTRLLALNPVQPAYGPYGAPHWWGEPWFGYYQSEDPWVIRKHMQMLANAGVDVLIFDNTNGPTYPDVYLPLCQVLEQMRRDGCAVPQIAFFTGHGAWNTLQADFYSKKLYPDLWFRWKGKPLMMVHIEDQDNLPASIREQFAVRESWAWTPSKWFGDGRDKWPWLDNFPQNYGWHESPRKPEEVAVTVGQHASSSIGRSSSSQREPPVNEQKITPLTQNGICFDEQFERALKIDPEFIFVTGWNEWTATRFKMDHAGRMAGVLEPPGGSLFVDEYNAEFSRDIEPAKGLLQDDYYYQLCGFVRRYKGARPESLNTSKTVYLQRGFSQWDSVQPEYLDACGDTLHRDHPGWNGVNYKNETGRNDIVGAKVASDLRKVYFYVKTKEPLTPASDRNWMMLFLNVGADYKRGWLGYDFVVDRQRSPGFASCSLERNLGGGYAWSHLADVPIKIGKSELMIAIPKSLLGPRIRVIDFKWADNIAETGEVSDFSVNGDVAPDDRFNYHAILSKS